MGMIENFEKMLAQGQDGVMLRFGLGNAYLKEKRYADAAEQLRKTVELDPAYSAAWKLLGKALEGNDQPAEAAHAYRRGIEVAEEKGDLQAAKEMKVFLKRLT
jgi:Tfp pilus assembly protein PilF